MCREPSVHEILSEPLFRVLGHRWFSLCSIVTVSLSLLSVLAFTCRDVWHLSLTLISNCHLSRWACGWWSAIVTENKSHTEGCVIRLHCVTVWSLTGYGFSFSRRQGAITRSLEAMRAFQDKSSGTWTALWPQNFQLTSLIYNTLIVSSVSFKATEVARYRCLILCTVEGPWIFLLIGQFLIFSNNYSQIFHILLMLSSLNTHPWIKMLSFSLNKHIQQLKLQSLLAPEDRGKPTSISISFTGCVRFPRIYNNKVPLYIALGLV